MMRENLKEQKEQIMLLDKMNPSGEWRNFFKDDFDSSKFDDDTDYLVSSGVSFLDDEDDNS